MPRYFFDVQDGVDVRDEVGREIEGDRNLRGEAIRVVSELLAAEAEAGNGRTLILTVRDHQGRRVMVVRTVCQIEEETDSSLDLAS